MNKKFKFSVIIPVYNVEDYLEETIESVVEQTIGFEDNIQLVLINDGSPDNSEEICLRYKEKYPNNVVYKKQQNAGVSKARNNGIKLADGELVNFLDSDDKWDLDTFKEVWKKYQEHQDVTVFTTKMKYFDAVSRPHILNYKFAEDKVVDITKDYAYPQLSTCSCFIKGDILKNYEYDASIKNEEDTKMISEILLDHNKMMVLSKPIYFYRKRPDQSSASQTSTKNPLWYTVTPKKVYEYLYEESKKRYGKVLDYFQYLIAYDIGWRINVPVPEDLLTEKEKKEYIDTLTKLIKETDFKFFLEQKNNYPTYSLFLLKIQEGIKASDLLRINDGNVEVDRIDEKNNCIQFIRVDDTFENKGKIYLYGRFNNIIFDKNKIKLNINGKLTKPEFYELRTDYDEKAYNDDYLGKYTGVKCCIDTDDLEYFGFVYDDNKDILKLTFANQGMITHLMPGSYFTFADKIVCYDDGKFTIQKKSFCKVLKREAKIIKGLLMKKKIKNLLMRWLIILSKLLPYKNVWLLSDRVNMADDNAEHLFKYINDNKIKGINAYYVISKDSKDFNRLKQYGKVVSNTSLKYKILFNNAKYIVSSHAEFYITNIYGKSNPYYRNLLKFKYAFLQHGITKDDISPWLNPNTKHIDMFVSAVELEYKSLQINGYKKDVVQLTGFPRYDGLVAKSKQYEQKNTILFSFTWRSKLVNKIDKKTGKRLYNEDFKNSHYFEWMNSLLNSEKLHKALDKYGYKVRFVPHPNLLDQIEDFDINEKYIDLVSNGVNYQKEFCENKLLVTDSSSIFFDFCYLKKPMIYYQPDNEEFYSGQIYDKGYFDYETMGFGPLILEEDKLIDQIINLIEKDCKIDKKYEKRIDDFFKYNDTKNCERVVEAIKNS